MPISTIDVNLVYPDGRRDHVRLRDKALNQGADGLIYAAPGGKLAIKLYHNPEKDPERPEKIRQMLQAPPDDNGLEHFAWPVAQAVNRKGRFIGYAMPLLPVAEYTSLDLLLTRKGRRLVGLPESRAFRVKAAENLARRVAQLHAKGHCVIDLKPANLLVHRKTADIVVVDCDGFAIQGLHSFIPGHQYTSGYIAPEAWAQHLKPEALGKPQDLFALAVIVFQLVNEGIHPYQGVSEKNQNIPSDTQARIGEGLYPYGKTKNPDIKPSPWSLHSDFPEALRLNFDKAFSKNERRPDANSWTRLFTGVFRQLKGCAKEPSHFFWGASCPICKRASVSIKVNASKYSRVQQDRVRPTATPQRATQPHTVQASSATNPTTQQFHQPYNPWWLLILPILIIIGVGVYWNEWRNEVRYLNYFSEYRQSEKGWSEIKSTGEWRQVGENADLVNSVRKRYSLPKSTPLIDIERGSFSEDHARSIPYFEIGDFDSEQQLNVLAYVPLSPIWEYTRKKTIHKSNLRLTGSNILISKTRYHIDSDYLLRDWHIAPDTNDLYIRKCEARMMCRHLARIKEGGDFTEFEVDNEQIIVGSRRSRHIRSWHYRVAKDNQNVIIASSSGLAIYDQSSKKALYTAKYPLYYADYEVSDLEVTADGKNIVVGLSRNGSYGVPFSSTVLEYTLTTNRLELTTDFSALSESEDYLVGPSVEITDNGQQLAIAEHRSAENNTSTPRWSRMQDRPATALPGIQIWTNDSRTPTGWRKSGSYSLPRRNVIRMPDNPAILIRPRHGRVLGNHSFNIDFEMTPDGARILSGIEVEGTEVERTKRFISTARVWLLDIENGIPTINAMITKNINNSFNLNPFSRLSSDGERFLFVWASYLVYSGYWDPIPRNELVLDISIFKARETDPPTPPADTESLTTR